MTKLRTFGKALTIDDQRAPWLGVALGKHVVHRKMVLRSRGMSPSEVQKASLGSFPREHFLQEYRRVAKAMNALLKNPTL